LGWCVNIWPKNLNVHQYEKLLGYAMSGGTTNVKGSAGGPVTPQIWMSTLADRLTILMPYSTTNNPNYPTLPVPLHSCNFTNQFPTVRCSQGAFVLAPDGTTNVARKIVEDSTASNSHLLVATHSGGTSDYKSANPTMRIAGIFKAVERTRVAMACTDPGDVTAFAICGYDLFGGQIGYGPSNDNSGVKFIQKGASITSLGSFGGGGWYLCLLDVLCQSYSGFQFGLYLDNGSGTAAQSTTYNGDGVSGIYGWRHSMLPVQAWQINSVCLFDDFLDLSTIDVNNTKAPGFNWYVDSRYPGWIGQAPQFVLSPLTGLTVNSSVLNIPSQSAPGQLTSAAAQNYPTGNGQFVGNTWRPPVYMEVNFNYPADTGNPTFDDPTFWTVGLDGVISATAPQGQNYNFNLPEFDFWEPATTYPASNNHINYPTLGQPGFPPGFGVGLPGQIPYIGCLPYNNIFEYNIAISPIVSGGSIYINSADTGPGNPPPNSPWALYTYGTDNIGQKQPNVDMHFATQRHTVGRLIVPYDPVSGSPGGLLAFWDGMFVSGVSWRPVNSYATGDQANTLLHTCDRMGFNLMWGAVPTPGGPGWNIDYVRVSK
jgi:hypothetical protein